MPQTAPRLVDLPNIGRTVAERLASVGIQTPEQLAAVGPVEAYRRLKAAVGDEALPICYYLYSLEGALQGVHWDALPLETKDRLVAEAFAG